MRPYLAALLALVWIPPAAPLRAQPQPTPLQVVSVRDGVYLIKGGSGANAGLIVGRRQVLVVDAKMTEETARAMLAEIAKITPNPVTRIILTHSDGDHVNGLAGFPKELPLVAHPNTRRDMEQAFQDPKFSALASRLPSELVTGERDLDWDGPPIRLLYFGPAHTQGDLVVYLPRQRVAFVGDLLFIGRDPLIHRHKGGTSFGLVSVLKKLLELDVDTYLSGHADPVGKPEVSRLIQWIEERQEKIKALVAQGKSLEEIRAAFGAPSAPQTPGRRPGFVEVIYLELTEKK